MPAARSHRWGAAYLGSPVARWAGLAALIATSFLSVFAVSASGVELPYRIDLDVYRIGGQVWLGGGELYGKIPTTRLGDELPFTYPPFAAILFSALSLISLEAANVLVTTASIAVLGIVVWVVTRALTGWSARDAFWAAVPVTAVLVWSDPMQQTLGYGQINLFLLGLVAVDVLALRGSRWQGALVGLALAIKLTPAVFLAYFLMRGSWRALAVGVGAAALYTAVGFALAPGDSVRYWTQTLVDPDRIGPLEGTFNQSINGVLRRLDVPASGIVWFVLCAAIGLAVLALLRRRLSRDDDATAFAAMALYMLLASPVSWMHHWVWALPAVLVAAWWWLRKGAVAPALLTVGAVAVFSWRVYLAWHGQTPGLFFGNAYVLWGAAWLAVVAHRAWRRPQTELST